MGKRLKKTGTADTTAYVYDGMYVVCEFDGSENLKASYVYANGLLLAKIGVTPEDTSYYHHDGLGSTMGLTDEDGKVAQAYLYDEFGNLLQSWGNMPNHYLYTGQEWDTGIQGTELYNLRTRYYDTGIGRFISEDPALRAGYVDGWGYVGCQAITDLSSPPSDHPQDLNAYPYVANNPTNQTDPLGLVARPGGGCSAKDARKEMRRIRAAYRECFKEMGYSWGPIETVRWWRGMPSGVCPDWAGEVITCLYRKVRMRCCTVDFVCHVVHASIRIDCYTGCGRLAERRRGDPYLRFPFAWW